MNDILKVARVTVVLTLSGVVILLHGFLPLTRAAASAPRAQPSFTFHARYLGRPVVLRLYYHRYDGMPYIGQGTLLAQGRQYRVAGDTSALATTAVYVVRVYGHPFYTKPASFTTLLGVFTLTWTCNPDCADSSTLVVHSIYSGPQPGVLLPDNLVLSVSR